MNTLAAFQDQFARALLDPDAAVPPAIAALTCQPGFSVYRNTVMKACVDALQANYPAVARLVGDEWFRAAAAIYARSQPPATPTLLHYGQDFPAFLAGFEPAAELPYLPAVATLDRLWTEAHAARDEAPLSAATVAALAPQALAEIVLRPHAAARWSFCPAHPAFSIWRHNRTGGAGSFQPEWRAEGALLTRPQDTVQWTDLDVAGCAFLDACRDGQPLAAAAAAALAAAPHTDLTQLMAALLQAGAFADMAAD